VIQMYLSGIRCVEETDEVGADEPYVLVTTVDLSSRIPAFDVVRYGPWDDVDAGETHFAPGISQSFWGLNGAAAPFANPDQSVFVVSLMENDDASAEAKRGVVKGGVAASVAGSLALSRPDKVAKLLGDINAAMELPTGGPNFDELIGGPQELRFSADELGWAEAGGDAVREMAFAGDGGRYTLWFVATNPLPNGFAVFGAIRDKWLSAGGPAGALKLPMSNETPTFDGVGRFQSFQGGIVSWHPDLGAHIVWGLIGERWLQIGREQFGYAITDETPTADGMGRYNHFKAMQLPGQPEASIFFHPDTGAHEVYGAIRQKWADLGGDTGFLRYPVSAEQDHPQGRFQQFQGGGLLWNGSEVVPV
jgi:uncharacterized protein with LGFP repeats